MPDVRTGAVCAPHWCEDVPEGTRTIVCNCGARFGEDALGVEDGVNAFADHIVEMWLKELLGSPTGPGNCRVMCEDANDEIGTCRRSTMPADLGPTDREARARTLYESKRGFQMPWDELAEVDPGLRREMLDQVANPEPAAGGGDVTEPSDDGPPRRPPLWAPIPDWVDYAGQLEDVLEAMRARCEAAEAVVAAYRRATLVSREYDEDADEARDAWRTSYLVHAAYDPSLAACSEGCGHPPHDGTCGHVDELEGGGSLTCLCGGGDLAAHPEPAAGGEAG